MADKAINGEIFSGIPERLCQAIFMKLAVLPSAEMGLLGDTNNLIAAADGSRVSSNANPNGHSLDPELYPPEIVESYRWYADPYARWGWDSTHECWYYGYTMYYLSVHNKDKHIDLPIYLRYADANRFDGITLISALAHARAMYQGILRLTFLTADSAHDNYATYRMLKAFTITPVIDINTRSPNSPEQTGEDPNSGGAVSQIHPEPAIAAPSPSIDFIEGRFPAKVKLCKPDFIRPDGVPISENGAPICRVGLEMSNDGYDKKRFRTKYRCPYATGKICWCRFANQCSDSAYGKVVYTKPKDDPRIYPEIPRDSNRWKRLYNNRTAAERVNSRTLIDYQLERDKRYGRPKLTFYTFLIATNIHFDAQTRFSDFKSLLSPWKGAAA